MYKLPVFEYNSEYNLTCITKCVLNFLDRNIMSGEGYSFSSYIIEILRDQFNCRYENRASDDVGSHYLEFAREQDMTFFLLRFS